MKQVETYVKELSNECLGGVLIAKDFQKKLFPNNSNIKLIRYKFENLEKEVYDFEELIKSLTLSVI